MLFQNLSQNQKSPDEESTGTIKRDPKVSGTHSCASVRSGQSLAKEWEALNCKYKGTQKQVVNNIKEHIQKNT